MTRNSVDPDETTRAVCLGLVFCIYTYIVSAIVGNYL